MKEWLTAKEIAEARLPHIPTTERAVQILADREGWNADDIRSRKRAGRGGGTEYHIQLLPTLSQLAYKQRFVRVGSPAMPAAANDEAAPPAREVNLSDAARLERDARLAILRAFDMFAIGTRLSKGGTRDLFVRRYNSGRLMVEDWVRDRVKSISVRSLARWRDEAKADRNRLAVDRSAARKGKGLLETANGGRVAAFIIAWLVETPAVSAKRLRGYCQHEFGDELVDASGEMKPLPPVRTFQHHIAQVKRDEKVVLTSILDPDTYRSTQQLVGTGAYRYITEPNGLWQIDASPIDVLCTDGRFTVYVNCDVPTRRGVFTVSRTPRASAVGLMIRKSILKMGVARIVKTDNGSDFVANETKRLFDGLGIEVQVSNAYSPEEKGHVERLIKTFQHDFCPQLPGYIGHNVAERKAIEGRRSFAERLGTDEREAFKVSVSSDQLQVLIDDWADHIYNEEPHSSLEGRSPNAVAAATAHTIRRVDERALDVLLMPVAGKGGIRRMGKQGLKIDHLHYMCGSILPGTDVFVRLDPIRMDKVYAFSVETGIFLDVAICPALADVNRPDFVKATKQLGNDLVRARAKEIKADVRELRRGPSGIERSIQLAKREAAKRAAAESPNVVVLPHREEQHVTPQIAAALDAATHEERRRKPTPLTGRAAEIHEQLKAELSGTAPSRPAEPAATVTRIKETPRIRFRRALDLQARAEAGEAIPTEEAIWLGRYLESGEYRAEKLVLDTLGGAIRR